MGSKIGYYMIVKTFKLRRDIMNKFKTVVCALTAVLAGCGTFDSQSLKKDKSQELPYTFSQFTDVPIPDGSQMDLDKSMMFGRETDWMGKMTFYAPYNFSGVFDFYMEEMPKFNWKELTSVRGSNSVLTYRYNCRVATVQLISRGFSGGTEVIISMAPSPSKRCSRDANNKVDGSEQQPQQNGGMPQQQGSMMQQNPAPQPVYNQNQGYAPQPQQPMYQQSQNSSSIQSMNTSNKSAAGSLGLGNASNMYYKSNSNGVGQPPRY